MTPPLSRRTLLQGAALGGAAIAASTIPTTRAAAAPISSSAGYRSNDLDPRAGGLSSFGFTGGFALDYASRSIGADLGASWASTLGATPSSGRLSVCLTITTPSHRLGERDFSLYSSSDNTSWTKIEDHDHLDCGTSVYLFNFFTDARYLKVHCHREHESSISVFRHTNLQQMMTVSWSSTTTLVGSQSPWAYRLPLTIGNDGDLEARDGSVYVTREQLTVTSLVSGGHLHSDLRDLRFVGEDGRQLHAYADDGGFFIRVPSIAAGTQQTIHACMGRADAIYALADRSALEVAYGRRTFQRHAVSSSAGSNFGSQAHPVQLPDGQIALVAGTGPGGLHARYSDDGGRTWGDPVPFLSPTAAGVRKDYPGGFMINPDTGTLIVIISSIGVAGAGPDFTNPAHYDGQIWCARATSFDSAGHPVFDPAERVELENPFAAGDIAYALTYSTPLRPAAGVVLAPVSYMYTARGAMAVDVLRSTDDGQTWTQSSTPLWHPGAHTRTDGYSEGSITQLPDGRIYFLSRNQVWGEYYFAEAFSNDNGATWGAAQASTVMASNTVATVLAQPDGSSMVLWSGHNSFGQQSFWRSNLTLSAMDAERNLTGYHDLTGGTLFSNPGWETASARIGMIEPMASVLDDTDLLIAWANHQGRAGTILVEDYKRYLDRSHGALDIFRHQDSFSGGRELSHSGWLRNTATGTLGLVADVGRPRLVMEVTSPSTAGVGASRLFPALRRGSIRFKVSRSTASSFDLVVQEAYSRDHDLGIFGSNSRGTAVALKVATDGSVTSSSDHAFGVTPVAGYAEADTAPATTSLAIGNLLYSETAIALDYNNRSFGLDLGVARDFSSLVITGDASVTGSATTRVEPGDLTLWTSDDNVAWTPLTGWTGTKSGLTLTFTGTPVTARYVKVSHPYGDAAFSLAHLIQDLITVLPDRPDLRHPAIYQPLDVPTAIPASTWTTIQIDIDLAADTSAVMINGTTVHTAPIKHPAQVVTHLGISVDAGAELRIDEFLVRDLDRGDLRFVSVGTVQPW